jgi:signal transduction histidine kinase
VPDVSRGQPALIVLAAGSPRGYNVTLNPGKGERVTCPAEVADFVPTAWRRHRWLICVGVLAVLAPGAQAVEGYSDPLSPPVEDECPSIPKIAFFQIPARLKQVDEQIKQETNALGALAPLEPSKQFDTFGYHSDYVPVVEGIPDKPLWTLDLDASIQNRKILGLVLVPAKDQRAAELKGYAFPKRFRIHTINGRGENIELLADWTERDFPDPGLRPVLFRFPSKYAVDPSIVTRQGVRLEVFSAQEDNGLEFFALGRVQLIRTDELHSPRQVVVSSSFESEPYWSSEYLASPNHTLGLPLSVKDGTGGDLIMKLPASHLSQSLVIRVELDELGQLGWVNLFPGHSPDGIDVPGYGFPQKIVISRLMKREGKGGFRRFRVEDVELLRNPGNNMVRITDLGRGVVALEIACNDFPVYQGQAVFALGEIEILTRGKNLSRGRPVSLLYVDVEEKPDMSVLVDGRVDGRTVLPMTDWIDQLAEGKPHEARLAVLDAERAQLLQRWSLVLKRAWVALGLLVVAGILAIVSLMLRSRKKAVARLRRQIYSDLHDEVGSNLGSISLVAGQLEGQATNQRMKEGMADLALLAREAGASLREVVWMIDQSTIHLPALVQKLAERAERVVTHADLSVDICEECPDVVVSLTFKRHLIMFFKEVVHNCARHAQATQVGVAVAVEGRMLQISVSDNGCGFDPSIPSAGWGLTSMKKRAQEMDGEMELVSQPGAGTKIVLKVPLAALSKEPNKAYKTSN